jgi:hypothetical protein
MLGFRGANEILEVINNFSLNIFRGGQQEGLPLRLTKMRSRTIQCLSRLRAEAINLEGEEEKSSLRVRTADLMD